MNFYVSIELMFHLGVLFCRFPKLGYSSNTLKAFSLVLYISGHILHFSQMAYDKYNRYSLVMEILGSVMV